MKLQYPFKGSYTITQTFEEHISRARANGWKNYNGGTDFGMPTGTPLYAIIDGEVEYREGSTGYGNHVRLTNGKYLIIYGHMRNAVVKNKQTVRVGDLLGYSDNTGNSTGPHLHFEIRENGIPVDPMMLLNNGGDDPIVIPPPDEEVPVLAEFKMPILVDLPKGKVTVITLNIRDTASTTGRVVGSLSLGDVVPAIDMKEDNGDIWVCIGYNQWVAGFWKNEVYIQF